MADIQEHESDCENDFVDPLGVNDATISELDSQKDDISVTHVTSPIFKNSEVETILAETSSRMSKLTVLDQDGLTLDIGEDSDEPHDMVVTVDNPEKHATTMESYITFRVNTKTSRTEFMYGECQVRRRYTDFLWLTHRLEESQPTHIVPPLPAKHSLQRFDRFSNEFVKKRQEALEVYLQRIAEHPVLSFNKYFIAFLTAKQSEFQAAKKEVYSSSGGFMSRMADSFHNISASYMMKNRGQEFVVMEDYMKSFGEKLAALDRISQRILKEEYEHLGEFNDWGPVFTLWSNSEDRLSRALRALAKAVEKCFLALEESTEATETNFTNPLKEYMLYCESIKLVLRRRDAIQMEYEMTQDELSRKKDERDQLQTQVEVLNDKATCANADLKADMERWHKNKRRDFKRTFMSAADRQIVYHQKCLKAWEDAIKQIQRTDLVSTSSDPSHTSTGNTSQTTSHNTSPEKTETTGTR